MYTNLLVPTDGSALSRRTIRDAAKLAAKLTARACHIYAHSEIVALGKLLVASFQFSVELDVI